MSRVYFHAPTRTAELLGSERAYAGGLASRIAAGLLNASDHQDRFGELLGSGHALRRQLPGPAWGRHYELLFRHDYEPDSIPLITWQGHRLSPFMLELNTVLLVGNEPMRFLARLHGQCEIHCWVDGPNRAWAADVIEEGVRSGLYRSNQGWESVVELLRESDQDRVVLSYSGADTFPNPGLADIEGYGEEWSALSVEERWERAVKGLAPLSEIKPGPYHFAEGLTVLDLTVPDWELRLARALEDEPS